MLLRRGALAAALVALPGCPAPAPTCTAPFFGDPAKPTELQPVLDVVSGTSAALVDLHDGDLVDLLPPPQGGFGLFAGARVKNIDPCDATIRGRLRDPATQMIVKENSRPFALEPDGNGYLVPTALASFSSVANVVACPDDLGGGIVGKQFILEITVTDRNGHATTITRMVHAVCPTGPCQVECTCVCGADYHAGMSCLPDGGADDGGASCMR